MIRSYKKVSQLNNSVQGGITYNNLTVENRLVLNKLMYYSLTGPTGYPGPSNQVIYTGPTGFNTTGSTGPIGSYNSVIGQQGSTGLTGPTGYETITGMNGPVGEDGINYQGSTGPIGIFAQVLTGPPAPTLSYTQITNTFNGVSSLTNQSIVSIDLNKAYYVQWYVKLISTNVSNISTILFGMNQDNQFISLSGVNSISGSGIYNSDIVFQCYYDGYSSDTFTISYQIGYIQLFNS